MSYYWFNREEVLKKAKEKYNKYEYYKANKDVLKEKVRDRYKNMSEKGKEAKKSTAG